MGFEPTFSTSVTVARGRSSAGLLRQVHHNTSLVGVQGWLFSNFDLLLMVLLAMNICRFEGCQEPCSRRFCSSTCAGKFGASTRKKPPVPPRSCANCDELTHNPKFCSRSCATSFSNSTQPKRTLEGLCSCGAKIPSSRTYCKGCLTDDSGESLNTSTLKARKNLERWKNLEWDGATPSGGLSRTIRNYLISEADNLCSSLSCPALGRKIPSHPSDGSSVLEINHIDGDSSNHSPDNLEVLCPTCHSLTSTYRARNIGKGRHKYYRRVRID